MASDNNDTISALSEALAKRAAATSVPMGMTASVEKEAPYTQAARLANSLAGNNPYHLANSQLQQEQRQRQQQQDIAPREDLTLDQRYYQAARDQTRYEDERVNDYNPMTYEQESGMNLNDAIAQMAAAGQFNSDERAGEKTNAWDNFRTAVGAGLRSGINLAGAIGEMPMAPLNAAIGTLANRVSNGEISANAAGRFANFYQDLADSVADYIQPESLNRERRALSAIAPAQEEIRDELYEQDIANGDSGFTATMKQAGRAALDTAKNMFRSAQLGIDTVTDSSVQFAGQIQSGRALLTLGKKGLPYVFDTVARATRDQKKAAIQFGKNAAEGLVENSKTGLLSAKVANSTKQADLRARIKDAETKLKDVTKQQAEIKKKLKDKSVAKDSIEEVNLKASRDALKAQEKALKKDLRSAKASLQRTSEQGKKIDDLARRVKRNDRFIEAAYVGLTEAAGGVGSHTSQINEMSFTDLYQNSPEFRELFDRYIESGMTPDEADRAARDRLAAGAENLSLLTNSMAALAANKLIEKAIHPNGKGIIALIKGMLSESSEEGLTGALQTLGENYVAQTTYDPERELTDDIVESTTESAIAAAAGYPGARPFKTTGAVLGSTARTIGRAAGLTAKGASKVASKFSGKSKEQSNTAQSGKDILGRGVNPTSGSNTTAGQSGQQQQGNTQPGSQQGANPTLDPNNQGNAGQGQGQGAPTPTGTPDPNSQGQEQAQGQGQPQQEGQGQPQQEGQGQQPAPQSQGQGQEQGQSQGQQQTDTLEGGGGDDGDAGEPAPTDGSGPTPSPDSGGSPEGAVDLRKSSGPDNILDDSSSLDNTDNSRDEDGTTEYERYARKQKNFLFRDSTSVELFNQLAQLSKEEAKNLIKQIKDNKGDLDNQELVRLAQQYLEWSKKTAKEYENLKDKNRWDAKLFAELQETNDFKLVEEYAKAIVDAIGTTDADLKSSEVARNKFKDQLADNQVDSKRANEVLRNAKELGFNEEDINELNVLGTLAAAYEEALNIDANAESGRVHRNIFTEDDKDKKAISNVISEIQQAVRSKDADALNNALDRIDRINQTLTNKVEALNYGINHTTNANIEYESYDPVTGEPIVKTIHAGDMTLYTNIMFEHRAVASLTKSLNELIKNSYSDLVPDRQYSSPKTLPYAPKSKQNIFEDDKETKEPDRTITLAERKQSKYKPQKTESKTDSSKEEEGKDKSSEKKPSSEPKTDRDKVGRNAFVLRKLLDKVTGRKKTGTPKTKFNINGSSSYINPYNSSKVKSNGKEKTRQFTVRLNIPGLPKTITFHNPLAVWFAVQFYGDKNIFNSLAQVLQVKEMFRLVKEGKSRNQGLSKDKWNEVRLQVMFDVLLAKFNQDPEARKELLDTGNAEIVNEYIERTPTAQGVVEEVKTATQRMDFGINTNDLIMLIRELFRQPELLNNERLDLSLAPLSSLENALRYVAEKNGITDTVYDRDFNNQNKQSKKEEEEKKPEGSDGESDEGSDDGDSDTDKGKKDEGDKDSSKKEEPDDGEDDSGEEDSDEESDIEVDVELKQLNETHKLEVSPEGLFDTKDGKWKVDILNGVMYPMNSEGKYNTANPTFLTANKDGDWVDPSGNVIIENYVVEDYLNLFGRIEDYIEALEDRYAEEERRLTEGLKEESEKSNLKTKTTLADGTNLKEDPLEDVQRKEIDNAKAIATTKSKLKLADIKNILNKALSNIKEAVFKVVAEDKKTEVQKATVEQLKKMLLEAEGFRDNEGKLTKEAERSYKTLMAHLERFMNFMNEGLNLSTFKAYTESQLEEYCKAAANGELDNAPRSITDWFTDPEELGNARAALFAVMDNEGNLTLDEKVNFCAGIALIQTLNDLYNNNSGLTQEEFEDALERFGMTEETFFQQDSEFRQDFMHSIAANVFADTFRRYFQALTGIRNNNEVSISYDGNAMIDALAAQAFAFASKYHWADYYVQNVEQVDEDGNTVHIRVPILKIHSDIRLQAFNAIENKDDSISRTSFLLLGKHRDVIQDLFNSDEGLRTEYYLDEEMPPLEQSRKINTDTPYTEEQLKAKETMRSMKYFLNHPFKAVFDVLGLRGMLALRGIDYDLSDPDVARQFNQQDLDSIQGQQTSVAAGMKLNQDRATKAATLAQKTNQPAYMRFDSDLTSSGRFQETTPLGPQNDKFGRQLWTQVQYAVHKNNALDVYGFKLAVLQGFGQKLTKLKTPKEVEKKFKEVEAILARHPNLETITNKDVLLDEILTIFAELQDIGLDPRGRSNSGTIGANVPLAVNCILNMQQWRKPGDFICNIYLEHDGSTNGFVNAVFKFASGHGFSENEVQTLLRGSIFPGIDMNKIDYQKIDKEDNYTGVAAKAPALISRWFRGLFERRRSADGKDVEVPGVRQATLQLYDLMNILGGNGTFEYHLEQDKDGNINIVTQIGRSVVKTPVTAVNYGQGKLSNAKALFNNLIITPFIARLTEALHPDVFDPNKRVSELFFHKDIDARVAKNIREKGMTEEQARAEAKSWAAEQWNKLVDTLDLLYTHKIVVAGKGANNDVDIMVPNKTKLENAVHSDLTLKEHPIRSFFENNETGVALRTFKFELMSRNKYNKDGMGSMMKNFRAMFADFIYDAVHEVRGNDSVEPSLNAITNVSNTMAAVAKFLERRFIRQVKEKTGRMPSRKDMQTFKKRYAWIYCIYRGSNISDLGKYSRTKLEGTGSSRRLNVTDRSYYQDEDGVSLQGFSIDPSLNLSVLPGVRGLALMVQALGDGNMQTWFYAHKDYFLEKYKDRGLTEEIFMQIANRYDGFEGPPGLEDVISDMCNEAAYMVISENPLKGIAEVWRSFIRHMTKMAEANPKEVLEMLEAIKDDFPNGDVNLFRELGFNERADELFPSDHTYVPYLNVVSQLAEQIEAKHAVLRELMVNVGHMAVNEKTFSANADGKTVELSDTSSAESLIQELTDGLNKELENQNEKTQLEKAKALLEFINSGTKWTQPFKDSMAKVLGSIEKASFLEEFIQKNFYIDGKPICDVKLMSRAEIIKQIPEAGMNDLSKQAVFAHGTIYIVSDELSQNEAEKLKAHEMLHAILSAKLLTLARIPLRAVKNPKLLAAKHALTNLFSLCEEFMEIDTNEIADEGTRLYIQNLQTKLSEYEGVEQVDEFIAYTLSDPVLKDFLAQRKPKYPGRDKRLRYIYKSFVNGLKKLFGMTSDKSIAMLSSFYGEIATNVSVIADNVAYTDPENATIRHYTNLAQDQRLDDVMERFGKMMVDSGALLQVSKLNVTNITQRQANDNMVKAITSGMDNVINKAMSVGLITSPQEAMAARYVMAAFAFNMNNNSATYLNATRFRSEVLKTLSEADFSNFAISDGQAKLDALFNAGAFKTTAINPITNTSQEIDLSVPLFMALSTVSSDLRFVLSQKSMRELNLNVSGINDVTTYNSAFDQRVADLTQSMFENLANLITPSGRSRRELKNLQQGIDAYIDDMAKFQVDIKAMLIPSTLMTKGDTWTKNIINGVTNTLTGSSFLNNLTNSKSKYIKGLSQIILATGRYAGEALHETRSQSLNEIIHKRVAQYAAEQKEPHGVRGVWTRTCIELTRELLHADFYSNTIQKFGKAMMSVVAQARSDYREVVPDEINKMFREEGFSLNETNSKSLNEILLKCDLGSLDNNVIDAILNGTGNNIEAQKRHLEAELAKQFSDKQLQTVLAKSQQLAEYMTNGIIGHMLCRNANAILNYAGAADFSAFELVDKYVSILALKNVSVFDMQNVRDAYKQAPVAFKYTLNQQRQLAGEEMLKGHNSPAGVFNITKGYYPKTATSGASVIAVKKEEIEKYKSLGYTVLQESTSVRGTFYMSAVLNPRATFTQGALQTIMHCPGGADAYSGFTQQPVLMRIRATSDKYNPRGNTKNPREDFIPVFDENGIVKAFDLVMDPQIIDGINEYETDFTKNLGNWMGRQFEETTAEHNNLVFIEKLAEMYKEDQSNLETEGYVNIFKVNDPVIKDALKLLTPSVRQKIKEVFPNGEFMVRRDMLEDVIGHRKASVTDMWTGNTRWSPKTQEVFQKTAEKILGPNACAKLLRAEKFMTALSSTVRNKIVIVSGTIAAQNLISNFKQLVIAGVPLKMIATEAVSMVREIETYNRGRQKVIQLEMRRNAIIGAQEPGWQAKAAKIDVEIQAERDSWRHMDIGPLIEAGEYSTIADIGDVNDDLLLSMGKFGEYIEKQIDKLPNSVKNAERYIAISKGTPIYRAMEKMTHYGDFVSKAILYKHLTRNGTDSEEALDRVRYEFVNYDMIPGRGREYLENMGFLWFYNYKLRSVRIAFSMLKHNPFKAFFMTLLGGLLPTEFNAGTPLTDNVFSSVARGTATYTMGPGMILDLPKQNLWYNVLFD